jgi:hypothetical protein
MLDSAVGKVVDTPAAREARAFVMNNMSSIMKERAGTAQSKQEAALVRSFLPSETDDAEQVIGKLQAYQKYLDEKRGVYMAPAGQPPTVSATQEQKGGRSASGQVVQRVASDADYEKLPSGAVFVGPDGKRRTKP